MTINEYLIKLQEDLEAGKQLNPVEAQQMALDIQNQAKRELTPRYCAFNALLPHLNAEINLIKRTNEQVGQCAEILKQLRSEEVAEP